MKAVQRREGKIAAKGQRSLGGQVERKGAAAILNKIIVTLPTPVLEREEAEGPSQVFLHPSPGGPSICPGRKRKQPQALMMEPLNRGGGRKRMCEWGPAEKGSYESGGKGE